MGNIGQVESNMLLQEGSSSLGNRKAVVWIILIGLLLRVTIPLLAFFISNDVRNFHGIDTHSYIDCGISLADKGVFARQGVPETFRTPGYPFLLLPGILSGSLEPVTLAIQVVLGCLTIYLVFRISLLLFETAGPALWAAAFLAVEPLTVITTSVLHTETLFAAYLALLLFYILRYLQDENWPNVVLAAIFTAACAYVRPVAYFLPLVLTFFLLVRFVQRKRWNRKTFLQIAVYFFMTYGAFFAWQVRNASQAGYWGFAGGLEDNLYLYTATAVLAQVDNIPREEQRKRMFALRSEHGQMGEVEVRRGSAMQAIKVVVSHPVEYLKLIVTSASWTLGGPGLGTWLDVFGGIWNITERLRRDRNITEAVPVPTEDNKFQFLHSSRWTLAGSIFLGALLGMYWLLGLIGIVNGYAKNREAVTLLFIVAAYLVFIPALQGIGYSRFRHPIMPILCVFGGGGFSWVLDRFRRSAL